MYSVFFALGLNALDLLTGFIGAIKQKTIDSQKLRDGMFKKVGFIIVYLLGFAVDRYGGLVGFNLKFSTLSVIVSYVTITEFVSISENLNKINPDLLPNKFLSFFNIEKRKEN